MKYRLIKLALIAVLMVVAMGNTNCGVNQEVARKASSAQLEAQKQFSKTLAAYFGVIENFTDAQLGVTIARVDDLTAQIRASYSRTLRLKLEDTTLTPEAREAIIANIAKEIDDDTSLNEQGKLKIAALVLALKDEHKLILQDYGELLAAEAALDQYIQMKSYPDTLVQLALNKVGEKTDAITARLGRAGGIMAAITALLPKKASV